jgi:peptide chain release factor 3
MIINHVRGVERQTRRLFDACQKRGLPVFTFINKLDQPGNEPLSVLDNIEKELGILTYPITWPIGSGSEFQGVFDRLTKKVRIYRKAEHGSKQAAAEEYDLDDAALPKALGEAATQQLRDEIELLEAAGQEFDAEKVKTGKLTPVYFGSALTNFGLDVFWQAFQEQAPGPREAASIAGDTIPLDHKFTAFVFKVQSNMDKRHRDRIAFLRVNSGVYETGAVVNHPRTKKTIPLRAPLGFLGQERDHLVCAYPGDIVGMIDKGVLQVGDTIAIDSTVFPELPRFPAEFFGVVRPKDPTRRKAFVEGMEQLGREGVIQIYYDPYGNNATAYVGVVGQLQFEVLLNRFENEYGVKAVMEPLGHTAIHKVKASDDILERIAGRENKHLKNAFGEDLVLFRSSFEERYALENYPDAFPEKPSIQRIYERL